VNFTEDVRKYAAEQGIAKEEALKKGMEAKSKEFVEKGAEVNAKILQALHAKLEQLDLIGKAGDADPYQRIFGISSVTQTRVFLEEKLYQLQKLAFATDKQAAVAEIGTDFLDRVRDTGFLTEVVKGVVTQFNLRRIVFLFDEAAHTFIPSQQEIFFEIFKLLHGGVIAVKAAVYPSVTSYVRAGRAPVAHARLRMFASLRNLCARKHL
jgi:hypothetical protein